VAAVSSVDLHPEDLLDRARRGEATTDERQRLRAHLADCAACRFEHVLADDCARAAAPPGSAAEDAEVLARVRRGATRAVRERSAARGMGGRGWRRRRAAPLVFAAAALLLFAATFAAATTVVRRVWRRGPEIEALEHASKPVRSRHKLAATPAGVGAAQAGQEIGQADAPVVSDDSAHVNEVPQAPKPVASPTPRRARTVAVADAETPGDLFARANAARRLGKTREASRLYRELEHEFPGSSEELVSRVTLGRWMLDRLNDPAGALARFDSYLANPVHTALREEALIGRALALGRLGRQSEERGAWTAFLAAFPGSVYAERARGRLETLR
jgi:Putative zinc-finger